MSTGTETANYNNQEQQQREKIQQADATQKQSIDNKQIKDAISKLEKKKEYEGIEDHQSMIRDNKENQIEYKEDCRDKTCCPTKSSPYITSLGLRKARLNEELTYARQVLMFFIGIFLFVLGFIIYSISKIYRIIKRHFQYKNNKNKNNARIKKSAGSKLEEIQEPRYDNFKDEYENKDENIEYAEEKDDYNKYQTGIQKTIDKYKYYNQKIKNAFDGSNNFPAKIDDRILDKEYDDWK